MSGPKRVQMSRKIPWRAEHPDAVIVARPSKWGNPNRVVKDGHGWGVRPPGFADVAYGTHASTKSGAVRFAVDWYRAWAVFHGPEIRSELAGKDLACWCSLGQPCHADVLLEIANGARP